MDIINTSKKERILLNRAKIKMLESDMELKKLSNREIITKLLIKYVGEDNEG